MVDDVVLNKVATIERCIVRVREEYAAALDLGHHLIRRDKPGLPQSARNVFDLLAQAGRIELPLAESLKKMVGSRNIAVHDCQPLILSITVSVI